MSEMSFLDHLVEFRMRVIRSLIGVLVGFALVYHFSEQLYNFLLQPLCRTFNDRCPVVYSGVAEPFLVYLKVGFVGGLFLAIPWIFYQLWMFISPGLHGNEKKWVVPFVFIASFMFMAGSLLGYFFIFPFAFQFFASQAMAPISPMLSMSDYFSFASGLLFAFGFLFEIPVFVVLLNFIGLLSAKTLWKTWRYALAGIFILSAIVTPADPYTMMMVGVPLSLLYMAALVICSLSENFRKKPA
ncbi:MAG: preprotein translocase subunit TatC [Bacteriovoracaceae bacterium]|nr:preprotein translocase subunit TatC [Bacteriovoracaceae bacterium]